MKTKLIGTMLLAGLVCTPAFADGRHAYPNPAAGTGRASFTAGGYSSHKRAAAPVAMLTRAEVRATEVHTTLGANVARTRATHEIDIDLHG
jgi:hypothetical protein